MSNSQTAGESKNCFVTRKNRLEYRPENAALYQMISLNSHRCDQCRYITRSFFYLQNHLERHEIDENEFNCQDSPPEEYFCDECKFSTYLKAYFRQHIREYHSLKKESEETSLVLKTYSCEDCPFWTNSCLVLLGHQMTSKCNHGKSTKKKDESCVFENGVPWHICHHCNYRTKYRDSLRIHIVNKHTPSNRIQWFKCNHCSYKAKNKSYLIQHVGRRHKSPNLIKWQKQCEFTPPVSSNLKYHMYTAKIKLHNCDKCEFKTADGAALEEHKLRSHKLDAVDSLRCGFCDYKTVSPCQLDFHVRSKHEEIQWVKCDQCEYQSQVASSMYYHKRSKHSSLEKRGFKCDQCEYYATTKSDLNHHILNHSDVKTS